MPSIRKRGTGYQATYRGPDGRERTKTFRLEKEAGNWIAVQTASIAKGAWVDPAAGRIVLTDYSRRWLSQRHDLRPTTRAKYTGLLERHILPTLGKTPLAKLSPSQVRSWHAGLSERHPATAAGAYRLLSTICRTAVDDDLIGRSPCRVVGAASEKAAKRPTATVAEIGAAVAAAPERYRVAILLAAWCQLRRGEVLGLQRSDVDLLHATVSIERTITEPDGALAIGPPKTDAGVRKVTMPANVAQAMTDHLARFVASPGDAWIFASGDGPASPRTLARVWEKARVVAGRPDLRLHDLRHTGLTLAAASGATTAELMHRAGHKSHVAAIRYQHATAERDRVLADALGQLAEAPTPISRTSRGLRADPKRKRKAK